MNKKVFFIQDTLTSAGTERSHLELIRRFSPEMQIIWVYFYPDHTLLDQARELGIEVVFLDLKGKYDFLNGIRRLMTLVKSRKPDLMVSSLYRSNIISRIVFKISGIPLLGTFVSDSYSQHALNSKPGLAKLKFRLFWFLDKITSSIPKLYISNSKSIAINHEKTLGVSYNKSQVIYRGRAVPDKLWQDRRNGKYRMNFIYYGRLLPIKGLNELLTAFNQVLESFPECTLSIYGNGHFRDELKNRIVELGLLGKVVLHEAVPDVQEKLYDYDCFVFPSWYEGFSGALVEAMMAGIPIIASDIPMNLEAVTPGVHALTFPVQNAEALAEKMIYAIEHPDEMAAMGKKAREEAIRRFDIEKIAKEYEEVLREVIRTYKKK